MLHYGNYHYGNYGSNFGEGGADATGRTPVAARGFFAQPHTPELTGSNERRKNVR